MHHKHINAASHCLAKYFITSHLCYVILFEHIKQEQERTVKPTEAGKNVNYFSHHLMQFLRTYVDVSSILPTSI